MLFSYLQVASGHKYNNIHEYPHIKVSMHIRDQNGKENYFFYSSLDFFCTSVKILFHCQISLSYL